jgi:tetratricopeptide (TPR) repeat protein
MKDILIYLIIIIIASNILFITAILLSKWARKFKNRKLHEGLINYLGLTEWFFNLPPEEQNLFREYYHQVSRTHEWVDGLTEGRIYSSSEKPAQLLWMVATAAMMKEDFQFANKLLSKAQSMCQSPWERQQVNIAFAYLYYKQRNLVTGARENCIHYCDISIKNIEKYGSPKNVPTLPFDHLISIYREMREFEKARSIIRKAIEIIGKRNPEIKASYEKKLVQLDDPTGS